MNRAGNAALIALFNKDILLRARKEMKDTEAVVEEPVPQDA